jgi:hypothetical protein
MVAWVGSEEVFFRAGWGRIMVWAGVRCTVWSGQCWMWGRVVWEGQWEVVRVEMGEGGGLGRAGEYDLCSEGSGVG